MDIGVGDMCRRMPGTFYPNGVIKVIASVSLMAGGLMYVLRVPVFEKPSIDCVVPGGCIKWYVETP